MVNVISNHAGFGFQITGSPDLLHCWRARRSPVAPGAASARGKGNSARSKESREFPEVRDPAIGAVFSTARDYSLSLFQFKTLTQAQITWPGSSLYSSSAIERMSSKVRLCNRILMRTKPGAFR